MNASQPFPERLVNGKAFEETASSFLTGKGFPIGLHFSAAGQWEFGESAAHVEIKNDTKWTKYENLFIETKERRYATGPWRPAGIYDASDPWFYLIGDPAKLWLLPVSFLKILHASKRYPEKYLPTAEGFVLPIAKADQISIRQWVDW